ncbi:MAG: phosphomannomutase/phosphoglucomutase [bacterium]|nr:phosphomannomutase/phosphoglucomutase [bacterium]
MLDRTIFRMYDIRGEFGREITPEIMETIGKAYSIYLRNKITKEQYTVSIGRDVRLHSKTLFDGLVKGLNAGGINVIDIGVCPTPALYFSLFKLDIDGGLMITASHNPPEFNGLKICVGKETIFGDEIQKLYEIAKDVESEKIDFNFEKGYIESFDILSLYRDFLVEEFRKGPLGRITSGLIKIGIDSGNGCAGLIVPQILKELNISLVELYSEPDGRFPNHHPDPTLLETLEDLIKIVKEHRLDLGISYDGDVDRIGIVDENGNVVYGDKLTYIFAKEVLKNNPGAKIISEVKASKTLFDGIEKLGGIPILSPVGHSLIKKKLREESALLAGEMSGHMFFNDRYFGYDDAIYATLRILEIIAREKLNNPNFVFSDLLKDLPEVYVSPEIRVDCPEERKFQIVEEFLPRFKSKFPEVAEDIVKVVTIDGLRVEFQDGWSLIRASNTQPALVLRFEANTKEKLEFYRRIFEETIHSL